MRPYVVRARSGSPGGRPANGIQVSGVVGCCDERRLQVLIPEPRSPVAAAGEEFGVEGATRKAVHRPMMPCTDAIGAYTKSHTLFSQVARSLDGIIYRPMMTYLMTETVVTAHVSCSFLISMPSRRTAPQDERRLSQFDEWLFVIDVLMLLLMCTFLQGHRLHFASPNDPY